MAIFEYHIHVTENPINDDFKEKLFHQLKLIQKTMATKEEILANNAAVSAALDNISADIAALDAKIQGAVTAADLDEIKASSAALALKASAIAALTPDEPSNPPPLVP